VRNFPRHGAIIPGVGRPLIGLAVAKNGVAIYVVKGLHFKNCTMPSALDNKWLVSYKLSMHKKKSRSKKETASM
jgi:hypothetical protein